MAKERLISVAHLAEGVKEVIVMNTKKDSEPELEKLYKDYFNPQETLSDTNEDTSLRQPSHLKFVESFTTHGISEDLFIHHR